MTESERTLQFRSLHDGPGPLLLPNPWDVGSAKLLAALGFSALATTSSGAALAHGLGDGELGRDAAIAHAAVMVGATDLPVSADMENGFGDSPEDAARTVRSCIDIGLAGCSIEDYDSVGGSIYPAAQAVERIEAAVEAAGRDIVLTARAENHIRGIDDLADTITRLTAYTAAGADVLYAPGLTAAQDIAAVVDAIDKPINVLAVAGVPPVAELAAIGVRRISVGGAFAYAAYAGLADAATELHERGTYDYLSRTAVGKRAATQALTPLSRR